MKKNKVLIVFPGLNLDVDEGAKHRLNCHINEYYVRGNDVTVLAICRSGLFRRDRKKFMNPYAKWILMPYILPISKHVILSQILDLYLGLVLSIVTWFNKYNIVQMELRSIKTKLCRSSFYVTDIHGDAVHEEAETKFRDSDYWFVKYLKSIQKNTVKDSDYCIVVSENLKKQIEINTNHCIDNYSIISCGVDYERFASAEKKSIPIDLSDRIVLGYSGGLQTWQNFDKMIDIVVELRKVIPQIFFLVYTNNTIDNYKEKLALIGEGNYYIKALMSAEVPGHLKLFDAGFLLRDDKILNKVSSPTKICEYLAAGVPMICTQFSGDFARSIIDRENGFVLKDTIVGHHEYTDLALWLEMVKNNRRKVELLCKKAASKRTFSEEFYLFYNKIRVSIHP